MTERVVKIYPLFERFWHWAQALLILLLLVSGLRVSGFFAAVPYGLAFMTHIVAAVALMVLDRKSVV